MMDEWFVTNGMAGFSPSDVFEYLKEVIEVPDEYKARFLDGQGRKNKAFEAHIQKRMLDELVKAYMSDGDVKRIQGGSRHIQDILVGLSDVQEYFERLSKPDREAELKKIGNKDTTLDAKEMRDMAERSTNIVLGAFIEEMKAGCPNISDFETNAKWIFDLRNRAVSRYIGYAAQTGELAEAADKMEGDKVGESGLRDASKLLADWTRSNSDLPDAESYYDPENFIGQPSEKEKMDKAAAERLFKDYMTNISKKVEIEKTLNTDSAGSTGRAAYQGVTYYVHEKEKRLNRYTPDYNFEKAKLRFDEKNRPYFEVEDQGTRYRYVFAPNKDTVDALVYEFSPSKKEWEGRETISNIGKKGWR